MPKRMIIYKKNEIEHKIEMSWGMFFRNFVITFDGTEVGRFEKQKQLNKGSDFLLPNGETLHVKRTQKIMTALIEVLINGQPVEGSDSDPNVLVKNAYTVAAMLCGLNFIIGFIAYFLNVEALTQKGFGIYNLVFSILYLAPILIGYKNKSWIALCFILALFLLDTVNGFFWMIEANKQGANINGGTFVVRFFFGVPLFLGAKAGFLLKDKEQEIAEKNI